MAEKRIHNPDKSSSADVSRVSRSHDQDGHHTHMGKNPVTVLVDSQVSDCYPWATCLRCGSVINTTIPKHCNL